MIPFAVSPETVEPRRAAGTDDCLELTVVEPDPSAILTPVEQDVTKLQRKKRCTIAFGTLHARDVTLRVPGPQARSASGATQSPAQSSRVKKTS